MSFGMVDEELLAAAKQATAASEQAHGLVLAAGPDLIAAALPGATAAGKAAELAADWGGEIRQWVQSTDTYGRSLAQCADQYIYDDLAAAEALAAIDLSTFEGL